MRISSLHVAAALCLLVLIPIVSHARLVGIAELQVSPDTLGITADQPTPLPITDLAFSPDGSKLAIGAGMYLKDRYSYFAVLIVSVPQARMLYKFQVPKAAISYEDSWPDLLWHPESDRLLTSNRRILIDLNSNSQDWFDHWSELYQGMLRNRRMLTSKWLSIDDVIRYSVHAESGDLLSTWNEPWLASIEGISFNRDAVALCRWRNGADGPADSYCETQIVGTKGAGFNSAWETRRVPIKSSIAEFGDEDHTLCGGKYFGYRTPSWFACWSVETGEQTSQFDDVGMWSSYPFFIGGTRVAMSDFDITLCPSCEARDQGPLKAIFRRRIVRDFQTGQELASWNPDIQAVQETWERAPRFIHYRYALSGDGRYLAEGGAGVVRIYEVVPDTDASAFPKPRHN